MSGARINIVRAETIEAAEGLDYGSPGSSAAKYDDVELVTPQNEPCAMLAAPVWQDNDVRYEYIMGGVGTSARRSRHVITVAVDYISNAIRSKLEQWQRDRALVWFCPGFGRHTEIAVRAIEGDGTTLADGATTFEDLTGRWNLTSSSDPTESYVWDRELQAMRGAWTGSNTRKIMPTRYGACQVVEKAKTNRHSPGHPVSATEGNGVGDAGWVKGGTHSADITLGIEATGAYVFGHADCRDALRVKTANAAGRNRQLDAGQQFDSSDPEYNGDGTLTGAGEISVSIWIKGRVNPSAALYVGQVGGSQNSVLLSDYDLSEWTKISCSYYSGDWSSGIPIITIWLGTSAQAYDDNFLIGPTAVVFGQGHAEPEWSEYDTAVSADTLATTSSSFRFPVAGSMIAAFYVPNDVHDADYPQGASTHLIENSGGNPGRLSLVMGASTLGAYLHRTASFSIGGEVTLVPGKINTIAATWGSESDYNIYCNGELIDTSDTTEHEGDFADSVGTLYFGGSAGGGLPLWLSSARIDHDVWTAAEVAEHHAALADQVANLVSVQARGRKYRIAQIPSTPRNGVDGAHWIGQLVLEEFEYDSNYGDITTAETY